MINISASLASAAFQGTSFSPERRGKSAVEGFTAEYSEVAETLRQHAEKGATAHLLDAELARFAAGFSQRANSYLASSGRCVSWMIAGPSNFPAERMNKRADIAHKRLNELYEYKARALRAAIRNLRPDLRPIMAGDADAIECLEAEAATMEILQERMKAVNAAHKAFVKKPESLNASNLSEKDKQRIREYKPMYSWEPHPFAPYQLSNHSANLRRIKKRIEQITVAKAQPVEQTESTSGNGVTVEDNPPANRIRVFFPGKPDEDTRAGLKKHGFRWTPSQGCWQAYRNTWSMAHAYSFTHTTQQEGAA